MSFNGVLFEDVRQQVKQLGDLLSLSMKGKAADQIQLYQEARIYQFMQCHTKLDDLFKSIYEGSELSKKEGANPQNAPGEVLSLLIGQHLIDKEQAQSIVYHYEAAGLLAYDSAWLSHEEDRKVFQRFVEQIPRYYYKMNTFVLGLAQRISLQKKVPHAKR